MSYFWNDHIDHGVNPELIQQGTGLCCQCGERTSWYWTRYRTHVHHGACSNRLLREIEEEDAHTK